MIALVGDIELAYEERGKAGGNSGEPVLFVYLDGSKDVIAERMAKRNHEYMPTSLLDSQFATLESPLGEADVLQLDAALPLDSLLAQSLQWAVPVPHKPLEV